MKYRTPYILALWLLTIIMLFLVKITDHNQKIECRTITKIDRYMSNSLFNSELVSVIQYSNWSSFETTFWDLYKVWDEQCN